MATIVTPRFQLALLRHSWEGNVRELKDVIEAAKANAKSKKLTIDLLKLPDDRNLKVVLG